MKNKARFFSKRRILLQFVVGLVLMLAVALGTMQYDLVTAQKGLSSTADYIKEQCNRYSRIHLAAETKSLMRIIEGCNQAAGHLRNCGPEGSLEEYAQAAYLTGLLLLDEDGNVTQAYYGEGHASEGLLEALRSPALLDTHQYPEKRYTARLRCTDNSEIDMAAVARQDAPGIVVAYYHTPTEYIESFNLSLGSMLSGYNKDRDGTIVVTNGEIVVASNAEIFVGTRTKEIPLLQKIKSASQEGELAHAGRRDGASGQYLGLMKRGRNVYVYCIMPERSVFAQTPRMIGYSLVAYILLLVGFGAIRHRSDRQAQKEYARRLQEKNSQLSAAVEEAQRANAAKTSFLSRMSHDIRTPLNGIIGMLEIAEAHPEDVELLKANREKMRVAADHLLSLVNDVLQMGKLESGELNLAHEVMDIKALASEVMTLVSQRAAESGVTMVYDLRSDQVKYPWVYGSPLHVRQIFLNIYTNCVKYNRMGGTITTLFQCQNVKENRVEYHWTISDTGIGMSQEFLRHIFDPFTQESTDARSVYQGTGLGMAIVKELVESMGGSICVQSRPGKGSVFDIVLPFEIAQPEKNTPDGEPEQEKASVRGLRLLLVEDNALNAEIAKVLLTDAGAEITWVQDGKQALDLFQQEPPGTFDGILMDIMMPVMDGLAATKAIRALDRKDAKTVPIIAMTANAFDEDAKKCLDVGMNAHLAKPLDIQKLIDVLARCVRLKNAL